MSDAPPPPGADGPADRHPPAGPLTPDAVEAALADFRGWLAEASAAPSPNAVRPTDGVDLFTLVSQFTALRHEVNLQTKAARAAVEQTAEALKRPPAADPDEAAKPLVKALVDIADALAASLAQVEKARDAVGPLLDAVAAPAPPPPRPGFFARLVSGPPPAAAVPPDEVRADAAAKLRPLVAGLADGYTLSLRRVERALPAAGLEPIDCVGRPFDPELMEVVEAVPAAGRPSGTVVEEVRRGYRRRGAVFRFALVKVAR